MVRGDERGMALLMVLVTFAITITTCVSLARFSTTARAHRNLAHSQVRCSGLFANSHAAIMDWLQHEADEVVLHADEKSPSLDILHDVFWIDEVEHRIRITAFDEFGMVPASVVRTASPLRIAVPQTILREVDRVPLTGPEAGLDRLLTTTTPEKIFPLKRPSEPVIFGGGLASPNEEIYYRRDPAIGEWIATHNDAPGRLNIHTTPLPLLKAAFRAAGRGGIGAIEAARKRGEKTTVGAGGTVKDAVIFVTESNSWAFRIDVSSDDFQRSWWAIYVRDPEWRCQQRLAIPR